MDVDSSKPSSKKYFLLFCILVFLGVLLGVGIIIFASNSKLAAPSMPSDSLSTSPINQEIDPSIRPIKNDLVIPVTRELSAFDSELANNWTAHTENNAEAIFELVEGGVSEEGLAIRVQVNQVSDQNNLWDIQLVKEDIQITPQKIQTYSAWVKGTKGAEVSFAIESPEYLNFNNRAVILTGEWQQVAFEFVADTELVRAPVHFASQHNKDASIIIDEIEIR